MPSTVAHLKSVLRNSYPHATPQASSSQPRIRSTVRQHVYSDLATNGIAHKRASTIDKAQACPMIKSPVAVSATQMRPRRQWRCHIFRPVDPCRS